MIDRIGYAEPDDDVIVVHDEDMLRPLRGTDDFR